MKPNSPKRSWTWLLPILGGMCLLSFVAYNTTADTVETPWIALAGVGIALFVGWVFLEKESLKTQNAKNTAGGVTLVIMALAILITVNILGHRFDKRFDLTKAQSYSLSDQSKSILDGLDKDLKVLSFFPAGTAEEHDFLLLMDSVKAQNRNITFESYDPNRDPTLARQYNITSQFGEVILEYGSEKQTLSDGFGEENFINTLVQLKSGKKHEICFSTGHQELDIDVYTSGRSMSIVTQKLQGQNYFSRTVNPLLMGTIPNSCEVFVIAGPSLDWTPPETEMIAKHVAQGGHLVVLLDVNAAPTLAKHLERYGFDLPDNMIVELDPRNQILGGDPSFVLLNTQEFSPHPIINSLNTSIILQSVRSVSILPDRGGAPLAKSSINSWGEKSYMTGPLEIDEDVDIAGPVPIISIVEIIDPHRITVGQTTIDLPKNENPTVIDLNRSAETASADENEENDDTKPVASEDDSASDAPKTEDWKRSPGAKIIVIGSSTLVIDDLISTAPGNLDLFLNTISWMSEEKEQLSQRANDDKVPSINLNELQILLIWIISLILLPGSLLIGAVSTWNNRRSL
ncbi:MAG: Gldg family protein [Myxococcota bacterium]|nr:Gldg family protein [Myxococcota bacterium]